MAGFVKKLRVSKKFESLPCAWCGNALVLGEEGAVCEACETLHHARCWDEKDGCGLQRCVNAPLRVLETVSASAKKERELKSDERVCPHCDRIIYIGATVCRHCGLTASVDGLYHGDTTTAPEAKEALVQSLYALGTLVIIGPLLRTIPGNCSSITVFIAIYLAIKAITTAGKANDLIANDPSLSGKGMVLAAQIVSGVTIAIPILSIILLIALLSAGP